jgi:hypothetical protein
MKKKILLNMFKDLSNDKISYPITKIPKSFYDEYIKIMLKLINIYKNSKQFFVYLLRNKDKKKQFDDNIIYLTDKQNIKWLNKYMKHFNNVENKYKQFVKDN